MTARDTLTVAAAQFASTQDLDHNLATCLAAIDDAAGRHADLVVLPEFCNHISVYESTEHCRAVAAPLDGEWLGAVAERARHHEMYVAITVTVPRPDDRVTVTSILYDPAGTIAASADKQTLMGNERAFLSRGLTHNDLADTAFGPVGLYACMDGVTFETPRGMAVRGARLLTNSLNSFALDEAALHIPVRAVENGVFVVAANKVGPLLPADQVDAFSAALGVPPDMLDGAGESQIVAPDGTVLARAPRRGAAVITAEIDLSQVTAPGRLADRRPTLYAPLAAPGTAAPADDLPDSVRVSCGTVADDGQLDGAQLVVLPELTPLPDEIADGVFVVTTEVVGRRHEGIVATADGIVHRQPQLHRSARHPDTDEFGADELGADEPGADELGADELGADELGADELGDELAVFDTPLGRLAVVVGDDHRYPEVFRLAAIEGAAIVAVCYEPEFAWEVDLALVERAAENRLCVVACAPPLDFAATLAASPPADSLWNPQRAHPYDGTINTPAVVRAAPRSSHLEADIHPARTARREVSRDTDLVAGRPWWASRPLTRPRTSARR